MTNSLRLRLLLWLLLPLTVFVAISGALSWRSAADSAELVQDRALLASARMIAGRIDWQDGALSAEIPPAALEIFAGPQADRVYFRVIADDGRLIAGRPDFPLATDFDLANARYATTDYEGRPLRMVALVRTLFDTGAQTKVSVQVGQTMGGHDAMLSELWRPALYRQIGTLVLAILLMVFGLTMELRPVMRISEALTSRDPGSLTPLRAGELQQELRPIIEAINQYMQRLNAQVQMQKRFVADAAHQLRTPLTVLDSQIQFARQLRDPERQQQVLQALQDSSRNMTDLTNKLLQLSQAEAEGSAPQLRAPVEIVGLAASVLEELVGLAQRKQIDLGFEAAVQHAWVAGSAPLFAAMIMNLVDNAIRYTPEHGKVTVAIDTPGQGEDRWIVMTVTDDGPGIPAEARERVFERFYRNALPGQHGAGLGLAIVREIAQAAQGSVTLAAPRNGIGLCVRVQLPASAAAA